jgi:hypothetical protein
MNHINKIIAVLILLLIVMGCGDDYHNTLRGAQLRSIEIGSDSFNVCNTSSFYSITIEVEDYENGNLLDNVTVFVSFVDITDDGISYPTAEEQFTVIEASEFIEGPNGLPTTTFIITLAEISSTLNIASYNEGDAFRIAFEINLTDGRSISSDDESPFEYDAKITGPIIDPVFFTGQYLMEQLSGVDPFFDAETFGDTQIVNITADGNIRSFDFLYFPGIYDADYNFSMTLSCGEILVTGTINAGELGCGSNVGFSTGNPVSTYDETFINDDVITVNVTDFSPDGSCDTGGYPAELRFTKQ